ncbi:MAG: hypothetical protein IPI44_01575 [Sulfuritalea sp.]|nr:hypothetical protein [Sulfuritalea sp.]
MSDAIVGGIVFKFDLISFGPEMGAIPNSCRAIRAGLGGARSEGSVEMRFEPPLPQSISSGDKGRDTGHPLHRRRQYRLPSLLGNRQCHRQNANHSDYQRTFRARTVADWRTDIIDWKTSPVDLPFLNAPERPAGKRGFVRSVRDKLIFEDGTPAAFWGTNLTAHALFGSLAGKT